MKTCAGCSCDLGVEGLKVAPFTVTESITDDGSNPTVRAEDWCPRCFCYKRAPMESERFWPGTFLAIKCTRCGVESVDQQHGSCLYCGSRAIVALPPKPEVDLGDTGGIRKIIL